MNDIYKFSSITVIAICIALNLFVVTSIAIAVEPLNNIVNKTTSVSSDVRQALDAVYLAAKDANLVNPVGDLKNQSIASEFSGNNKVIKSSRDPVMQMIAVGLGVTAAMMVMNYFSGGTSTSSSFSGFSSAMLGGMLGDYAYRKYYAPPLPSVPSGIAQRITP